MKKTLLNVFEGFYNSYYDVMGRWKILSLLSDHYDSKPIVSFNPYTIEEEEKSSKRKYSRKEKKESVKTSDCVGEQATLSGLWIPNWE